MSRRRKGCLVAVLCVLALVGSYGLYIYTIAGELRSIEPHFAGTARLVEGPVGAEDIVILGDGSTALLSSQDRSAHLRGGDAAGTIYAYDLTDPAAKPVDLLPDAPDDFRPHGIGLYEGDSTYLFVVNHPRGSLDGDLPGEGPVHTIEIFLWADGALHHRRRIADSLLVSPNDVAPIGPDRFYVTNDHGTGDPTGRMVEDYLRIPGSHLLYFDGTSFTRLPGDYLYANGVAVSRDHSELYLAATTARTVYVFARVVETGALRLHQEVFCDTGVDNIDVGPEGDLWIGCHPQLLTFVGHMEDPSRPSPSQVLRLHREDNYRVEEVFLSDGTDLPGSSCAARFGNRLLIGPVLASGFLDCTLDEGVDTAPEDR